jgi:hypothetical protein
MKENLEIQVSQVLHTNDKAVGESFRFGPPGTVFEKPVEICLATLNNSLLNQP